MIISDLNHLETVSAGSRVVGGFFRYGIINKFLEKLAQYRTSTITDNTTTTYAGAYAGDTKAALTYTANSFFRASAYAEGPEGAFAASGPLPNGRGAYAFSVSF